MHKRHFTTCKMGIRQQIIQQDKIVDVEMHLLFLKIKIRTQQGGKTL